MARRVLLVDPDLDALGELSAALRGNGFTVILADNVDGALERAKQASPDIILASIAVCQPGELTDKLKSDGELAKIPSLVLVTGLDSRQDRERGMEVGADAYIGKTNFDQSNLLEVIRRLI